MDGCSNSFSSLSSCGSSFMEQPMSPKSPTGGLDLYGKRRQLVKVQILEKEIGLLQEELKSIEALQPASRCCKEIDDFIGAKPDPLLAINEQTHKVHSRWKRLWFCFSLQWTCCFSGCWSHPELPKCCACGPSCNSDLHLPSCMEKIACQSCCKFIRHLCLNSCYCCFHPPLPHCTKVSSTSLCNGCIVSLPYQIPLDTHYVARVKA